MFLFYCNYLYNTFRFLISYIKLSIKNYYVMKVQRGVPGCNELTKDFFVLIIITFVLFSLLL